MGDNECAPQKLVRLVGCRDPKPVCELPNPESMKTANSVRQNR